MFQPKSIDFSKTTVYSARNRTNLVNTANLRTPGAQPDNLFESPEFDILVEKLNQAKVAEKTVTCFIGAHVIKCGLSRYLIWLMEHGYITLATAQAASTTSSWPIWGAPRNMYPRPLRMEASACGRKPVAG